TITVSEPAFYGGSAIAAGDSAYVWFSETDGGEGLAWRGVVETRHPTAGAAPRVVVRLLVRPIMRLGIADLEAFRDFGDGLPMGELSRKLYYHAPNKIAALSPEAASLLDSRFA